MTVLSDEVVTMFPEVQSEDIQMRTIALDDAVRSLLAERDAWSESDANQLAPEDTLWQAVDDLVDSFAFGTIPGHLRKAQEIVSSFSDAWDEHKKRSAMSGNYSTPVPAQIWKSVEMLSVEINPEIGRYRPIESIQELLEQKVSKNQICRMYGPPFCHVVPQPGGDVRRIPQVEILNEEIAHPGKYTGKGTGWTDPNLRKHESKVNRQHAAEKRVRDRMQNKSENATRLPAESMEQLAGEGVSVSQIARMYKTNEENVLEYLNSLGVEATEQTPINLAKAPQEPELDDDQQRILDAQLGGTEPLESLEAPGDGDGVSVDRWILTLHGKGMSVRQINEEVNRNRDPESRIHGNKIRSIIRLAEEESENQTANASGSKP